MLDRRSFAPYLGATLEDDFDQEGRFDSLDFSYFERKKHTSYDADEDEYDTDDIDNNNTDKFEYYATSTNICDKQRRDNKLLNRQQQQREKQNKNQATCCSEHDSHPDCGVCFRQHGKITDEVFFKEYAILPNCRHSFCKDCIQQWLQQFQRERW